MYPWCEERPYLIPDGEVKVFTERFTIASTYSRSLPFSILDNPFSQLYIHQLSLSSLYICNSQVLWHLDTLGDLQVTIRQVTDCSFLYWSSELFPALLKEVYAHPEQAHRLKYVLIAFGDPARLIRRYNHATPIHVDFTLPLPVAVSRLLANFDFRITIIAFRLYLLFISV